ncbi:MAG TPA: trehalose-6-phosphate synthase [Microthrixaceae bacterium]|nr:trehalose-6-phosphate synthase [Microthrixaceae bacterium]
MSTAPDSPIVIVSNRGPLSYEVDGDKLVARRGGGGLISGLGPLVDSGQATWIAAAMSEGDRVVAGLQAASEERSGQERSGQERTGQEPTEFELPDSDLSVELIALDSHDQSLYYDVISNGTLWFLHHGLYDLVRSPTYLDDWWDAWDAYRRVNRAFAERVARVAPHGATVLIQDYHLTLLPQTLCEARPDLTLIHFLHTPFAGPDNLRVMPDSARDEMLNSLMAHHACGFHTAEWAANFVDSVERFSDRTTTEKLGQARLFTSTLSSDPEDIALVSRSPECEAELGNIESLLVDEAESQVPARRLIVRVDRMELSKNIVRGFQAFDLLLERRADLRGRIVFFACCYPSRDSVAEYTRYRDEVLEAAQKVNDRWTTNDWTPVSLNVDDNYPRSVAALRRYDVLIVNPIRDGLNLVAKEGPMVNERSGQLVLSTQAGAWTELGEAAIGVNPFDVAATADAMARALDIESSERLVRAERLAELARERTPADWLADQLAAAGVA